MVFCSEAVSRLRRFVRRFAPIVGIRGEDVHDLEQEVLVTVYQSAKASKDFSIKLAFDIARKRVLDASRKRLSCVARESSLESSCQGFCDEEFEDRLLDRLDAESRLRSLDTDSLALIHLEADGFSDAEKAAKLGVNLSTIWWRKNQVRKALCHA